MTADVECLHCGRSFRPRRRGHVFCSHTCRHQGELPPGRRIFAGEGVELLFDPSRDPKELVTVDDWHPKHGTTTMQEPDCWDTVEKRRRWLLRQPVSPG